MSSLGALDVHGNVYIGIWTNWSKGKILGATLTTTQRNGALLIAVTALFITYISARLWRTLCFIIHNFRSSKSPQDGVFHQTQVTLRNSANASSALWSWMQMSWHWRDTAPRPIRRISFFILLAMLMIAGTGVAGIFSSRIATLTGREVLLIPKNCNAFTSMEDSLTEQFVSSQIAVSAANYAQNCYSTTPASLNCQIFVKSRLSTSVDYNASCPFHDSICLHNDRNIKLDTGYINTHHDLGLNTAPEDRFDVRIINHCAPLVIDGHKEVRNVSQNGVSWPYAFYYYGERQQISGGSVNYTYAYPYKPINMGNSENFTTQQDGYFISSVFRPNNDNQSWTPEPTLQRNDADVAVYFLSANNLKYFSEVNDDLYRARNPISKFPSDTPRKQVQFYAADEVVTVLGCADQSQLCIPQNRSSRKCSPLSGLMESWPESLKELQLEGRRSKLGARLVDSVFYSPVTPLFTVRTLGPFALTSSQVTYYGMSSGLPDNQWKKEVEFWHSVTLASWQQQAVQTVLGAIDQNATSMHTGPKDDESRYLCRNQKILSSAHLNFSVFGLAFTLMLGSILILISCFLESLSRCLRRKKNRIDQYSLLEWNTNDVLQLHRLAHEELGYGNWRNCTSIVPITDREETLAILDLEDVNHPRLMPRKIDTNTSFPITATVDYKDGHHTELLEVVPINSLSSARKNFERGPTGEEATNADRAELILSSLDLEEKRGRGSNCAVSVGRSTSI